MELRAGALAGILLTSFLATGSLTAQGTDQSVHPVTQVGVVPPMVLQEVKPQYTAEAMRARVQGTVRLRGVVERDGTVSNVEIVRSLDPQFGLDAAAVASFKEWRFSPAVLNGQPIRVQVVVDLNFTLRGGTVTGWPQSYDPAREAAGSRQDETVDAGGLRFHFQRPAGWVAIARSAATPLMLRSSDGVLTVTLFPPAQTTMRLSRPVAPPQLEELLQANGAAGLALTASGQVDSRTGLFWVWAARRSSGAQVLTFFHTQGDQLLMLTCEEQLPTAPGASAPPLTAASECSAIVNSIEVMAL
jgi:TonB family protein